jgi:hypothetical protein
MSDLEYNVVPAWSRYVVSSKGKLANKKTIRVLWYTLQQGIFFFSDFVDITDVGLLHRESTYNCSADAPRSSVLSLDLSASENRQVNWQPFSNL